jgi:MFS superfamily sulfate permease-like transporter
MVFGLVVFMTVFWNLLSAMAMGLAVAFFRFVKDQADRYKADLNQRDEDVKQEEEDLIFSFARDYARKIRQNGGNLGEISGRFESMVRDRILIVRPHGPLFFGAIDWLTETVEHLEDKDVLIIRCKWLDELDLSGAYALGDLIEAANRRGVAVLTAGMSTRTRQVLGDLNELSRLEGEHICAHFNEALELAMQIVEKKTLNVEPHAGREPVLV